MSTAMATSAFSVMPLNVQATEPVSRTIMMFIVGSNLEGISGQATHNLKQSMDSEYNENLNYVVMTGGSDSWKTPSEYLSGAESIDPEFNQIWLLEGKRDGEEHGKMSLLEKTGLPGLEQKTISSKEVLTSFVDYCYNNYPADQYDIILWNHGGGPCAGFGFDNKKNIMSITDLMTAFNDCSLIKDGGRFEMIDFDACIMGNTEITAELGPYTDYFVYSTESEPGEGQEYMGWMNALQQDPSMNGFDFGREIVDSTLAYYANRNDKVTLSVIDVKNYNERLLPQLEKLDEILISEAKETGTMNGRYNFYDELYSLDNSFIYGDGNVSLFDLGNLAGALSVPQSEVNNESSEDFNNAINPYTDTALEILSILRDQDNSGDDVIYYCDTKNLKKVIKTGYLRDKNGNVVWPDELGKIEIKPTGISITFPDDKDYSANRLLKYADGTLNAFADDKTKNYYRQRLTAIAYYSLISELGRSVSRMTGKGYDEINTDTVSAFISESKGNEPEFFENIKKWLVSSGEFANEDELKSYISDIVSQQYAEVVSKDKVRVQKIINQDDSSDSYKVTISNSSAQAFMSVDASVKLSFHPLDSGDFKDFITTIYGNKSVDELYPNGISFVTAETAGELDFIPYLDDLDESKTDPGKIYQRMYASDTSEWKVPCMSSEVITLIDESGTARIADVNYLDKSNETANIPILIKKGNNYSKAFLYVSKGENDWQIDGLSFNNDTVAERTYIPMNDDYFTGASFAAGCNATDNVYSYSTLVPICDFTPVDKNKENWGITFGTLSLDSLNDPFIYQALYYVHDVYKEKVDVTDLFTVLDNEPGSEEPVYDISCPDVSIAEAVYDGTALRPAVTLTHNGKKLQEGVDYKIYYLDFTEPGYAYLMIGGLGNYIGYRYVLYDIKDGHTYELDHETPASCTKNGERVYICSECGDVYTETIEATWHDLIHHPAAEPTRYADGNIEYWECGNCGAFFSDENGENEITPESVIVKYTPEESSGEVSEDDKKPSDTGEESGKEISGSDSQTDDDKKLSDTSQASDDGNRSDADSQTSDVPSSPATGENSGIPILFILGMLLSAGIAGTVIFRKSRQ